MSGLESLFEADHVLSGLETVERFAFLPQLFFRVVCRLDRKPDPALGLIDFNYACFDFIADLEHVFYFRNAVFGKLRNVNETINVVIVMFSSFISDDFIATFGFTTIECGVSDCALEFPITPNSDTSAVVE